MMESHLEKLVGIEVGGPEPLKFYAWDAFGSHKNSHCQAVFELNASGTGHPCRYSPPLSFRQPPARLLAMMDLNMSVRAGPLSDSPS